MSDEERLCQRAGCLQAARVTLTFRYDARQASLTDLQDEKHPVQYDLCAEHADLLIVPRGWERLDRRARRPEPAPRPAPTGDRVEVRGSDGAVPDVPRIDRYAALTARLPELAEAFAARARAHRGDVTGEARRVARDRRPAHTELLVGPGTDEQPVLEGQLQMPIEPEPDGGVVVALTRSRE
jgi:hypothetical protein